MGRLEDRIYNLDSIKVIVSMKCPYKMCVRACVFVSGTLLNPRDISSWIL